MSEPPYEDPDVGPDAGSDPGVGSAGEEAVKLFGALSDWARDHGSDLGRGANDSPECTYCPLCRTMHVVRQTSPEVRAHLASAAASLMQAAAGILATAVPPDPGAASGVERIDLDTDTDGAWPGEDDA